MDDQGAGFGKFKKYALGFAAGAIAMYFLRPQMSSMGLSGMKRRARRRRGAGLSGATGRYAKLAPNEIKSRLKDAGIDFKKDYYELSFDTRDDLMRIAKDAGYRPSNSPLGRSKGYVTYRYFERLASK